MYYCLAVKKLGSKRKSTSIQGRPFMRQNPSRNWLLKNLDRTGEMPSLPSLWRSPHVTFSRLWSHRHRSWLSHHRPPLLIFIYLPRWFLLLLQNHNVSSFELLSHAPVTMPSLEQWPERRGRFVIVITMVSRWLWPEKWNSYRSRAAKSRFALD